MSLSFHVKMAKQEIVWVVNTAAGASVAKYVTLALNQSFIRFIKHFTAFSAISCRCIYCQPCSISLALMCSFTLQLQYVKGNTQYILDERANPHSTDSSDIEYRCFTGQSSIGSTSGSVRQKADSSPH